VASVYLQIPSITPPSILRTHPKPETDNAPPEERETNMQVGKIPDTDTTGSPSLVAEGALDAVVDIAKLLYESMCHDSDHNFETGTAEDLRTRRGLYSKATKLKLSLPTTLQVENNFSPSTSLLR
jgi:hypothetical protein